MATAGLPENVEVAYPGQVGESSDTTAHRQHHSLIHQVVNDFDLIGTAPKVGDILQWNGTAWTPTSSAGGGNLYLITGPGGSAARVDSRTGGAIPTGGRAIWATTDAVFPVNFATGDIWLNQP